MRPACRLATVALILALAMSVAGCGRDIVPQPTAFPKAEEPLVKRMMPLDVRPSLPAGFPIEVPVIAGSLEGTSASVNQPTWVYTLDTQGPADAVARWYERAHVDRSWREKTRESRSVDGGTAIDLVFVKGHAESLVHVEDVPDHRARVRASLGIGQAAPRTY